MAWDRQGRSGLLDEGAMGILPIPERRVAFAAAHLGYGVDAFHGHHEAGKEHLGTIILSELKFECISLCVVTPEEKFHTAWSTWN